MRYIQKVCREKYMCNCKFLPITRRVDILLNSCASRSTPMAHTHKNLLAGSDPVEKELPRVPPNRTTISYKWTYPSIQRRSCENECMESHFLLHCSRCMLLPVRSARVPLKCSTTAYTSSPFSGGSPEILTIELVISSRLFGHPVMLTGLT